MNEDGTEMILTWRNRWLLKPENYLRFGWELLIMLVLISLGILVPYSTAFEPDNNNLSESLDLFTTIVFSMDILINFNTGFYNKGELTLDRIEIMRDYLSFWFWVDLVTTIPVDSILQMFGGSSSDASNSFKYIGALRAFKLIKLVRLTRLKILIIKIQDRISNKKILSFINLFKLLLYIFLIAHLFACVMFKISADQISPNTFINCILNKSDQFDDSFKNMYVSSLYWAIVTMATIGYGDITPQTSTERIFGVITMLFCSLTYGFIIGNIGSIIEKYNSKENRKRQILVDLNVFMKREKLDPYLRFKTRKYMEFIFNHQESANIRVGDLLSSLSLPLQEEVLKYTNGAMLKKVPIFSVFEGNFEQKFSRVLENLIFSPSDILIREGEKPEGMFFIINGIVEVFDNTYKCKIQNLGEGNTVGEIGLFTKQNCVSTITALHFVEAFFLDFILFYKIIDDFPKVKAKLEIIRASCQGGNYSALHITCFLCTQLGHVAKNCSEIMNETNWKRNWLNKRRVSQQVRIGLEEDDFPLRDKREAVRRVDYSIRNVQGRWRGINELFPRVRMIMPVIKRYLSRKERDLESRAGSLAKFTEESVVSSVSAVARVSVGAVGVLDSSDEEVPLCEEEVRSERFNVNLLR